jgi:hypothetical protein
MSKRQSNRTVLAGLRDPSTNSQHIFTRMRKRIEAMRIVTMFFKRARADKQKAESNIELYLDDWAYQHGTPITKANMEEAITDCIDRVLSLQQAKQQAAEEKEFRALQGPLGDDFDGGPFADLPGDGEFRQAILKQQPELKK